MRSRFILTALAIVTVCSSSCGIFRQKEKSKSTAKVDSVSTNNVVSTDVDTSYSTYYRKTTIFGQPQDFSRFNSNTNRFAYPGSLIEATNTLVNSTKDLTGIDKKRQNALPRSNLPMPSATVEEWGKVKNGKISSKSIAQATTVKKDVANTTVKTEGNSKTFIILCVVGGFVVLILVIFAFLYFKSRLPAKF